MPFGILKALANQGQKIVNQVQELAPELKQIGWQNREIRSCNLARMTPKGFICDSNMLFDSRKSIIGYNNSQSSARFNGGGKEYGTLNPESAIYFGTRSPHNNLYPTLLTEAAFYANKQKYYEMQNKKYLDEKDPESYKTMIRNFYHPKHLFPSTKAVVVYTTTVGIPVINMGDYHQDLEVVLKEPLLNLKKALLLILAHAPESERDQIISASTLSELQGTSHDQPLSLANAISLPIYWVSAPLGNCFLSAGLAVEFYSARADIMPSSAYQYMGMPSDYERMGMACNIALPMQDGVPLPLNPIKVYVNDENRGIVGMDVSPSLSLQIPSSVVSGVVSSGVVSSGVVSVSSGVVSGGGVSGV